MARRLISFPVEIEDSYSMLIETFHDMSDAEREGVLRDLRRQYSEAMRRVKEYDPLIPYLVEVHEELNRKEVQERMNKDD